MKSAIPLTLLLAVASAYGQQQSDTYGENLGTVHFPCSCSAAAVPQIERGVALLHHMTYEGAEAAFAAATKTDPGCAMGYWGMAMTHIHPLWPDVPSAAQMEKGMELIAEAKAQKQITAREHAYITALESYYKHGPNQDEKVRLAHFDAGWKKVHEQFPDDLEAASFYALAHMATATPEDKTYAKQKRAGALAERVLTLIPEHPGAHHYIIYAYLQKANDQLVKQAVESMLALEGPIHAHGAAAHTLAAVPVRYALERHQWAEAAALQPGQPDYFPWEKFPAFEAIIHFARALGGARSGDLALAAQALDQLAALRDQVAKTNPYWAKQVEIQRTSAQAWLEYAQGKHDEALQTMRAAAALEASTDKHGVTPGEVLPARELLADLLLELGEPDAALIEYEATLKRSPNRWNSLYGAGRAAELAGYKAKAVSFYRQLVGEQAQGVPVRERLRHAKALLASE